MAKRNDKKELKTSLRPAVHSSIQGINAIQTLPKEGFRNLLYNSYDYLTRFRWYNYAISAFTFTLGMGINGCYNWYVQQRNSKVELTVMEMVEQNKIHLWFILGSAAALVIAIILAKVLAPMSKERYIKKFENYEGLQVIGTGYNLSTTPIQIDNEEEDPNG